MGGGGKSFFFLCVLFVHGYKLLAASYKLFNTMDMRELPFTLTFVEYS